MPPSRCAPSNAGDRQTKRLAAVAATISREIRMRRLAIHALALGLAVAVAADHLSARPAPIAIQPGPPALTDSEFWSLVTGLSEPGGVFAQQLMSNEDSVNFVVPRLKETIRPGGIYVGVGSEQNFTYVAATQPRLALVVDIRRDNMLQM